MGNSSQPSYSEVGLPEFSPLAVPMTKIRRAIPPHLFKRDTIRSFLYLLRDLTMAAIAWRVATYIDPCFHRTDVRDVLTGPLAELGRWGAWCIYWWFQGLIFTGIWVIGHECGHEAFSPHAWLNDTIGFVLHSFVWTPYFSWRISHRRHHLYHSSMERDEVYLPRSRSELGIPRKSNHEIEWDELFGDTPVYTLYTLMRQQLLGFPAYLMFNVSGRKEYPAWTNHFDPNSILFQKSQRPLVLLSNFGLLLMAWILIFACRTYGMLAVIKYYTIPWLCVTHWFVMITYVQHVDQSLPHYRRSAFTFQRSATATIDRPFLGWQGRFFLHDVAHYHVIHHFFTKIPWYNCEEATRHLKPVIGEHYRYDNKPVFKTLWDTYNACQFVDDEGRGYQLKLFG
ncbi:hypothetical protein PILCRDRAFT_826658 [Piloderma croceum F 1598]|uniref:Fatty acid desaturase domain-containing protein n=1 Tax=Piloderma croceum (strain F 1598) TaxID=765440 RepID=A0A0C3F8X2_PILCF|nr:hypothetical protein PILCRDRAFT_826658 [Piloderma croceum F 1598]